MKLLKKGLLVLAATALLMDVDPAALTLRGSPTSEAMAKVGRPASPGSVAGAARRTTRRTTRRVWRRTTHYVSVLPHGCGPVTLYGVAVWNCGGVYYQHQGTRYVVVVAD
ncbi:hypothetical protein ACVINZ_006456 [Mesorhizobium jarvisii]